MVSVGRSLFVGYSYQPGDVVYWDGVLTRSYYARNACQD